MATPEIREQPTDYQFWGPAFTREQHARNQGEHRKQQTEGCDVVYGAGGSTLLCMGLFSRFFVQALLCTVERDAVPGPEHHASGSTLLP
jgi:hypothetical protein